VIIGIVARRLAVKICLLTVIWTSVGL